MSGAVDEALVEKAAQVVNVHRWESMGVSSVTCECGEILHGDDSLTQFPADEAFRAHLARAVLAAVWDDLPAARRVVDRDALVEWFHEREHKHRWPCTYDPDVCANLRVARYQADGILAAGIVQDAAAVRRAVAEEIAAAIEERKPHIPVSSDPQRRERIVQRVTLNVAARIAREAANPAAAHPRSP